MLKCWRFCPNRDLKERSYVYLVCPCHLLQAFLNSETVKEALNTSRSPLAALTVLKKICVHPNLLSERAADAVAFGG